MTDTTISFQSFETEARTFLANAVSDAAAVASDLQSALNSPLIAPFVPQVRAALEHVLIQAGLPVGEIETVGAEILAALNSVSRQAAASS